MIWVILALLISTLVGYMVWISSYEESPPVDPEEATKAALELHAIRRRLDVAQTRSELRRDAAQLRRELADELDDSRE